MSTHAAPPGGSRIGAAPAAVPAAIRSGQGRRPNIYDQLRPLADRFDRLMRDVEIGARSQRQHDSHIDEAEAIATELRAAFRGRSSPEPVNAPLWHNGGKAAW